MAIETSLLAHYRFESLYDSSGNNRTLTLAGGANADSTTKKLGGASYNFDGIDDALYTTASGFDGLSALTVSAWIYVDTKGNFEHIIAKGFGVSSADVMAWLIFFDDSADQKLYFGVSNGSSKFEILSDSAITTGTWIHVVGHWDGATVRMYLNNVLQASTLACSSMANINDVTYPLTFGRRPVNNDAYFDGRLDEVLIWSRAISLSEIAYLYNNGTGRELQRNMLTKNRVNKR